MKTPSLAGRLHDHAEEIEGGDRRSSEENRKGKNVDLERSGWPLGGNSTGGNRRKKKANGIQEKKKSAAKGDQKG